jgi:hypothetical protein
LNLGAVYRKIWFLANHRLFSAHYFSYYVFQDLGYLMQLHYAIHIRQEKRYSAR